MLLIEQFLLFIFFLLFLLYIYIKITESHRSTFSTNLFDSIDLTTSQQLTRAKPSSTLISQSDIPNVNSANKMHNESIFTYSNQLDTGHSPHSTSDRGNRNLDLTNTKDNVQVLSEQHRDHKEELQKSKRLYGKFFRSGTETKMTPHKKMQSKTDRDSTIESKNSITRQNFISLGNRREEEQRSESHKSIVRGNTFNRSFTNQSQSDAYAAVSKSDISDVLNTGYIQSDSEDSKESETGFKKKFDLFIKKLSQSSNESDLLKKVMVSNSNSSDSVGTNNDGKENQEQARSDRSNLFSIAQVKDEEEDEDDKHKNDSFGFTARKIDFSYEAERLYRGSSNSKESSSASI